MIHAIVFDLDGVLFDGCTFHKEMFLQAVAELRPDLNITSEYHDTHLNGLSTRKKIELLDLDDAVFGRKQELTEKTIDQYIHEDAKVQEICRYLVQHYTVYCVSNSIRSTIVRCLGGMGVLPFFTGIISNEDTPEPKPSPAPYLTLYSRYGLTPSECLILEDSPFGIESARVSGGHVLEVSDCKISLEMILEAIQLAEAKPPANNPIQ